MKTLLVTKTQKIEVTPYSYVNDIVTCEIPETEIHFTININQLETETGEKVTRNLLGKLFELED